jgi:hypothetical protein
VSAIYIIESFTYEIIMIVLSDDPVVYDGAPVNPTELTPFGIFDAEPDFQYDAPRVAEYVARRLGYSIIDVELIDKILYTCFEDAIMTYGSQVNQFNARENILSLQGMPTSSIITQRNIVGSPLPQIIRLSSQYGTEAQSGGNVDIKRGWITPTKDANGRYIQEYDLQAVWADVSESGKRLEIRRVYHFMPPAVARYYDPFATTGLGLTNLMGEFGFDGYSPPVTFVMMPAYEDLLRIQAIEINDTIRKSQYSFEIFNNKIRFSPIFKSDLRVFFDYMLVDDKSSSTNTVNSSGSIVADYSNIPYNHIPYSTINSIGRTWIFKFTLALAKETLGLIRSKYENVPIPDAIIKLDGELLRRESKEEKDALMEEIRDTLEQTGLHAQMQKQAENSKLMQEMFSRIPSLIYIG